MITKYASAAILSAEIAPVTIGSGAYPYGAQRTFKKAHRHSFAYQRRPGYLYVRSRAISSRCNDNYDEFPAEEIKTAYRSFVGKPVFVNHKNDNHRRARGVVIDAALHEDTNPDGSPDTWVEVLMEVDAVRFPKLAEAILKGEVDRTSMGTDVAYSKCSFCGNKASTPLEYCQHIPKLKGKRIRRRTANGTQEDVLVREICYGLKFFENSLLVEEPADPTAYFLGVEGEGIDAMAKLAGPACPGTGTPAPRDGLTECPVCHMKVYADGGVFLRHTGERNFTGPRTRNADWLSGWNASLNDEFKFLAAPRKTKTPQWDEEDEELHPRGQPKNKGQFSKSPNAGAPAGGDPAQPETAGEPKSADEVDAPTPGAEDAGQQEVSDEMAAEEKPKREDREEGHPQNPIETDDVEVAAKALAEGKHVNLRQPKQVSTLLDKLGAMIKEAKAAGRDMEIDLCAVTVRGTNLFCVESKGIPRIKMPQLKAKKVFPGSRAEKELQPGENGEYDIQSLFRQHLLDQGVLLTPETEKATHLKATQNQLRSSKIAGMADWIEGEIAKTGKPPVVKRKDGTPDRLFVSKDDYIVDGHHRWAALAATDWADGKEDELDVDIERIDMDIIPLIAEANKFCEEWGMPFLDWLDQPDPEQVKERGEPKGKAARRALAAQTMVLALGDYSGAPTWTINYRPQDEARIKALAPHIQNGPNYRRGVVENLKDYSLFAGRGDDTAAEMYLLYAEGKTVREAQDIIEGRLPFEASWSKRDYSDSQFYRDYESGYGASVDPVKDRHRTTHWWWRAGHQPPGADSSTHVGEGKASTLGEAKRAVEQAIKAHRGTTAKLAYGETKAPAEVDTLRDANCPVCGEESAYDGEKCLVCGFVKPPDSFMDPDLEQAKQVDLRQEQDENDVEAGNQDLVCDQCGAKFNSDPTVETQGDAAPEAAGDINAEFEQMFVDDAETKPADEDEEEDEDGKPKKKSKPPWLDKQKESFKFAAPGGFPQSPALPHPPSKDDTPTAPKLKTDEDQPGEVPETTPQAGDTCPECGKGTLRPVGNDKLDEPKPKLEEKPADSPASPETKEKDQKQSSAQKEQSGRNGLPGRSRDRMLAVAGHSAGERLWADQGSPVRPSGDVRARGGADSAGVHGGSRQGSGLPTQGLWEPGSSGGSDSGGEHPASRSGTNGLQTGASVYRGQHSDAGHRSHLSNVSGPISASLATATHGEGADVTMRPVLAALAEQQKVIDRQQREILALRRGLNAIARLAGVDEHPKFVALMKVADENNPAQPIADPPAEAPAETTEEALGDLNDTDVEAQGATPVTDVSADATTDVTGTETVLDEPLDLNEQDPTKPVAGTEGPRPLDEVKTETEVRIGNPNNGDTMFPLEGDFAQRATTGAREARTFASLRLARLRIQAGIDDGDDLALATDIASSDASDEVIQAEIDTLSKVMRQSSAQPRQARRNLVPRSASRGERAAPSFTAAEPPQPQMQVVAAVDADEILFE